MAGIGPFKEPISKDTARQVAAVVPHVQLEDLRLVSVAASLGKGPSAATISVTIAHHSELDLQDKMAVVRVRYVLEAKPEGQQDAETYIRIEATFQLAYVGESLSTVAPENWTTFANVNAVHNSWPYVRELVQNITARMGVDPFTVPLLKGTWPTQQPKATPAKKKT